MILQKTTGKRSRVSTQTWLGLGLALVAALSVIPAWAFQTTPGDLDPTFDGDGLVTTDFGSSDAGYAVALQSDGKIVVIGKSGDFPTVDFAVARYNPDGGLDTTFGTGGLVTTDFGNYDIGYAVVLQTDDKIVVVGGSMGGDFALARYNPDGSLDTDFGTDGLVTTDFGSSTGYGHSVALQTDDKIVVAGHIFPTSHGHDFAVARYNSDGSLDTDFGTGGLATTDFGGADHGFAVALQSDGKIVVTGNGAADFAMARYNSDGSLDTDFGTGGLVTTDFGTDDGGAAVALQPDGKIVVAGWSGVFPTVDFAVARYNSDGSLDSTFGSSGTVTTNFGAEDAGSAVALQPDGKIMVAGQSGDFIAADFAVARYNSDGSLDSTFGSSGTVTTDFGFGIGDSGRDIALQSDGKIVVAGGSGSDFAVARYLNGDFSVYLPLVLRNNASSLGVP